MTFLEWLEATLKWMSENQMTVLWIIIGIAVVVYGVWWTAKKARGGLVEWARLLLQSTWGVVFLFLFPLFSCILIVAIAMLTDLVPWTFERIDNIVNNRPFFSEPVESQGTRNDSTSGLQSNNNNSANQIVPSPIPDTGAETFTTGGNEYVVSIASGATVRDACSSTGAELGTIPMGSTVTLSTPVDSNCVDNVCQRATVLGVDPLPSGFNPVGGCIHLAAVNPK